MASTSNRRGKAKTSQPWTTTEEITLCKAWCEAMENYGTGDMKKGFWLEVFANFQKEMGGGTIRGYDTVVVKWKNSIRPKIAAFSVVYESVQRMGENGSSDLVLFQNALAEFGIGYGHPFTMEACWRILKDHAAWTEIEVPSFNKGLLQNKFHDDMDLPSEVLLLQPKGGHGSHNGFSFLGRTMTALRYSLDAKVGTLYTITEVIIVPLILFSSRKYDKFVSKTVHLGLESTLIIHFDFSYGIKFGNGFLVLDEEVGLSEGRGRVVGEMVAVKRSKDGWCGLEMMVVIKGYGFKYRILPASVDAPLGMRVFGAISYGVNNDRRQKTPIVKIFLTN
ncbi:hypothetical protein Tco_0614055 [Tanacetum coccineum]